MDFQRKQIPFLHKGMNWNSPVEKLQDGEVCWAKNVRVLERGTVSTAHGHTQVFTIGTAQYIHTISRLNITSEATDRGSPAFDPGLRRTYVVGSDQYLWAFQDQITAGPPYTLNPLVTPQGQVNAFSGNPLSVVDAQPAGAAVAWKYVGDSKQMVTVGYYPGDQYGVTMARCLTVGLDPPALPVGYPVFAEPGGQLTGNYQWAFAFRRLQTGARSNPSAASRFHVSSPPLPLSGNAAQMTLPTTPIDPQTGFPDGNVVVDIYRFGGTIFRWALVGTGAGGTSFTDNTPDEQLLAAPSPPQVTDQSTGLTRFNLYRPFVTQDIAHLGQATLQQHPATGVYYLVPQSGYSFNPQWVPGSTITLNDTACTIYQIQNSQSLEISEDISGQIASGVLPGVGSGLYFRINAGTLMTGQPLPHLWGPYGIGLSGSYIFACGDPNARGTLYWTNGNDPDSTDIVNNIIVTSPSERLMTGCVYDGQPFCWSTERQFAIYPSLTVFGQFTTQEVAGAKGVWLEWSLSVQNNGFADQSVSWRGKDGIYDWSAAGLRRLTDPLYSFFPHDNNPSIAPEGIMPFIGPNSSHPENVGPLDDTQPKYHRLCWFQGLLYYDFVGLTGAEVNTYSTLVWDTVNTGGGGWVSLDQPFINTSLPVARSVEIGANLARYPNGTLDVDSQLQGPSGAQIFGPAQRGGNLKVSWGNVIYDYYGLTRGFESRFLTRAEDLGDSRAQKRWGDYWLDCTPLDEFSIYPLAGFHLCAMQPVTTPGATTAITPDFCNAAAAQPGARAQFILDFVEFKNTAGHALLSPTLGLDIRWFGASGQYVGSLYQWQPSFVIKPEVISLRATDPDDMGALQTKYFTGLNLEANTFGQILNLDVILDGQIWSNFQINHNGQSEKAYAFNPNTAFMAQLECPPQNVNGQPPTWQFYKAKWIYEVWPDSTTRDSNFSDLGYVGSKFMQGMVVPMETGGTPVTFNVVGDCGQSVTMGPVTTPSNCKQDIAFSFSPCNSTASNPFIASQVQISPNMSARFWYDQIRWIWEPEPELVATWQTQPTDHDFATWHHHRDCFIAYRGGNGTPTLYITTEYGTEAYPLDPVTPGQYVRCYRALLPQKAKWRSYRVEGCGLFRLYIKDCAVRVKEWGSTGPYIDAQPFGDLSRTNGGARI